MWKLFLLTKVDLMSNNDTCDNPITVWMPNLSKISIKPSVETVKLAANRI